MLMAMGFAPPLLNSQVTIMLINGYEGQIHS